MRSGSRPQRLLCHAPRRAAVGPAPSPGIVIGSDATWRAGCCLMHMHTHTHAGGRVITRGKCRVLSVWVGIAHAYVHAVEPSCALRRACACLHMRVAAASDLSASPCLRRVQSYSRRSTSRAILALSSTNARRAA